MEKRSVIYCAEDDEAIRELLECAVRSSGYDAETFETAEAMLSRMAERAPDLVLLDIMLPGIDGLAALTRIRETYGALPVILVTAKGTEMNKVRGLDLGADDYITKPFGVLELVARIRARLRTCGAGAIELYGVRLDAKKYTVEADGARLALTAKEFELLKTLMSNAGAVMKRDELLNAVWGYDFMGETRTLDMHVMSLRNKLGDKSRLIGTVRGVGYVFGERDAE